MPVRTKTSAHPPARSHLRPRRVSRRSAGVAADISERRLGRSLQPARGRPYPAQPPRRRHLLLPARCRAAPVATRPLRRSALDRSEYAVTSCQRRHLEGRHRLSPAWRRCEGRATMMAASMKKAPQPAGCGASLHIMRNYFARLRYSPVRVSISILSPCPTNSGTLTLKPVAIFAGFRTLPEVSPLTAGSV